MKKNLLKSSKTPIWLPSLPVIGRAACRASSRKAPSPVRRVSSSLGSLVRQVDLDVWLRKQLKGTAWLSAVSSQSGRGTRGARVVQVGAGWAGRGAKIEV